MIDVAAVAQRMLTGLEDYFDAQGWDLPERRYVAAGQSGLIAADDGHLAVGMDSMSSGVTGAGSSTIQLSRAAGAQGPPRAVMYARLMRCVATIDDSGEPPAATALHADGLALLSDPGRLLTAVYEWRKAELMPLNPNANVDIGDVDVIGPMGGMAGHKIVVKISPVH